MKKMIYELTRKKATEIRAADYEGICKNKEEALRVRKEALTLIALKQKKRRQSKAAPYACAAQEAYKNKVKSRVEQYLSWYPAHSRTTVTREPVFSILTDYEMLSGYGTWRSKLHTMHINIPIGGAVLKVFDGIMVCVERVTPLANIGKLYAGISYMRAGNSYQVIADYTYVLQDTFGLSAHGETAADAIKAYRNKVRVLLRKKSTPIVTPDTYVDKKLYHEITGACNTGMNMWLDAHKLPHDTKITAGELLEILHKEKAYGVALFEKAVKENTVNAEKKAALQNMLKHVDDVKEII